MTADSDAGDDVGDYQSPAVSDNGEYDDLDDDCYQRVRLYDVHSQLLGRSLRRWADSVDGVDVDGGVDDGGLHLDLRRADACVRPTSDDYLGRN